jgi:catechol 2,3-dioxygenase-like lactoylglutathione lyase family enzyme
MPVMIGRLHCVAIDCPDPEALAAFYSELLGLPDIEREGGWVVIHDGSWPRIGFQPAPDHRPPAWPDPDRPQQMHFDVWVDDIDTAEARVLELGATPLAREDDNPGGPFRIYADPAGHPFCLEYER